MAKKEVTLKMTFAQTANTSFSLKQYLCKCAPVKGLAGIYSELLEERVSPERTLHYVHAQVAIFALILFGGASISATLLLTTWSIYAILCAARQQ